MHSLIWKDRPLSELLRIAWPITVSMLSYSAMTLVDTVLIGHVGRAQLAGVGLGGIVAFVLLCFSIGLLRGANTLVSQAVGAGRRADVPAYQGAAIVTALGLGLVTALCGQGVAELLRHLAATEAAGQAARSYLRIRSLGAPCALLFIALREVRYGQGESRGPMRASLLANIVNIALAYTFVFVFKRGVAGAATATLIASAAEAAFLALPMRRHEAGLRSWTTGHLRTLWRLGVPLGLQFTLEVGAFLLLSLLISLLSEVQMAAHQIAIQVIHLSFLPAFAVAEATAVLSGQAVGADRDDLVPRVARLALLVAGAYAFAWTLFFGIAAGWIAAAFTADALVMSTATGLLHVAAVFQIMDASNVVARGALRGAGDVRYAAVVGVITSWLFTPPVTWLLGYRTGMGARGGWWGLTLEIAVSAAILWWRLARGGWQPAAQAARARLRPPADAGTVKDAPAPPTTQAVA
ncbi:MAG: multidrug resistance protein family [Myxococcales bacterium]|jgi:MATE family multidrug resistance protein|nr:multidrug resistance protein family [Myxococcales bacterium]